MVGCRYQVRGTGLVESTTPAPSHSFVVTGVSQCDNSNDSGGIRIHISDVYDNMSGAPIDLYGDYRPLERGAVHVTFGRWSP